jgi:hypothetical protein
LVFRRRHSAQALGTLSRFRRKASSAEGMSN